MDDSRISPKSQTARPSSVLDRLPSDLQIGFPDLDEMLIVGGSCQSQEVIHRNSDKAFICLFEGAQKELSPDYVSKSLKLLGQYHGQGRSLKRALAEVESNAKERKDVDLDDVRFVGCDVGSDMIVELYCTEHANAMLVRNGVLVESIIEHSLPDDLRGGSLFDIGRARWRLQPSDRILLFTRPLTQWVALDHLVSLVSEDEPDIAASSLCEIVTILSGKQQLFLLLEVKGHRAHLEEVEDEASVLVGLKEALENFNPVSMDGDVRLIHAQSDASECGLVFSAYEELPGTPHLNPPVVPVSGLEQVEQVEDGGKEVSEHDIGPPLLLDEDSSHDLGNSVPEFAAPMLFEDLSLEGPAPELVGTSPAPLMPSDVEAGLQPMVVDSKPEEELSTEPLKSEDTLITALPSKLAAELAKADDPDATVEIPAPDLAPPEGHFEPQEFSPILASTTEVLGKGSFSFVWLLVGFAFMLVLIGAVWISTH